MIILSSEQDSDERLSEGPLTVLRLCENLIERLRVYWPIEGINDERVGPNELAFAGIFDTRKALETALKETDLPEFLEVPGFSSEIREALVGVRRSFTAIASMIADSPHRGTLLTAVSFAAFLDATSHLRRLLERDERVLRMPRLPLRVPSVGPGVWKRRPNLAEFVPIPAHELAAFELATKSIQQETQVDTDERETETRLRSLSLEPSADAMRALQHEAAELSEALNEFNRSTSRLSLKLSIREGEAVKPVLSACFQLGMTLGWRGRSSFKHHAATSMKSQEEAVQERIDYLDEKADPLDFHGWPEPQRMAEVLDKIAGALKLTVTILHCQDICIGRNIRWLVADGPKDFPFDASRAKYRHAFGWTADALRAIASPNDVHGWIDILVDDDLFLWPDLSMASRDLSLAARMIAAHLRRLAKSDRAN